MTGAEWALIASAVLPFLKGIFGGKKEETPTQTTETTTEVPYTGYRSPSVGFLDPFAVKMLMSNLGDMQYAGMPKGYGGLGMDSWMQDIMALLEQAWPDIMKGLQGEESQRPYVPDAIREGFSGRRNEWTTRDTIRAPWKQR